MSVVLPSQGLRRARHAVSAAFFVNGFAVGHWAPKIPVLVERLGISEAVLGRMIILFGAGATAALLAGAWCVSRFGAATVVRWTSLMLVPALTLVTITPTVLTTALAMLWFGMFLGAMDNAMNANGVEVELKLARPVMSSYHGFWSLGGVAGGLTGGAMIVWLGEMGHALAVGAIMLAIVVWAWPGYLPDSDPAPMPDSQDEILPAHDKRMRPAISLASLHVLGLVTLVCFAPEGTVIDWSGLYLSDELGAPLFISGYAFAAFSATMAAMRLTGDRIRARLGDRPCFVASGLVAAFGLTVAGLANGVALACFGFFVAGLGMANMVPILFSTAGRFEGVRRASAIAMITFYGYAGLLFVPAFVGMIAERYSLSVVFAGWGVIVVCVALGGFAMPGLTGRKR